MVELPQRIFSLTLAPFRGSFHNRPKSVFARVAGLRMVRNGCDCPYGLLSPITCKTSDAATFVPGTPPPLPPFAPPLQALEALEALEAPPLEGCFGPTAVSQDEAQACTTFLGVLHNDMERDSAPPQPPPRGGCGPFDPPFFQQKPTLSLSAILSPGL